MNDFFSLMSHDFKVAKLGQADAQGTSDHIKTLKNLVAEHDVLYPKIEHWFQQKVIPGLASNERVAFLGYYDEKPVAAAILKKEIDSKICHINIMRELRGKKLGQLFSILMVLEVREFAKKMHLTMPESLWENKQGFFKNLSLNEYSINDMQYRKSEMEFRISGNYHEIWESSKSRIADIGDFLSIQGLPLENDLLMSIQPQFARKILSGQKRVEIRKKFNTNWENKCIKIYSSFPDQSIIGEARIAKVIQADPGYIWDNYNNLICCEHGFYLDYTKNCGTISAIFLEDIISYKTEIPLSLLWHLTKKELRPPQSHLALRKNSDWAEAVSIATLLFNSFSGNRHMALKI